MNEKEVRDIVKGILRSEFLDIPSESNIKKIAREESEKVFEKLLKDYTTNKDVKDIVKQTMHAYHKWMWEKKGMWINQI